MQPILENYYTLHETMCNLTQLYDFRVCNIDHVIYSSIESGGSGLQSSHLLACGMMMNDLSDGLSGEII